MLPCLLGAFFLPQRQPPLNVSSLSEGSLAASIAISTEMHVPLITIEERRPKSTITSSNLNGSVITADLNNSQLLYIAMFSPHGLIRSVSPELGRDMDTGGQVTYVLEICRKLSPYAQVDLFTRLIVDKEVSEDYQVPQESLAPNVNIVRIKCGPDKYICKEMLWEFFDEFSDRALSFILNNRRKPAVLHGHYADGAYIAQRIADVLGCPHAYTGHSMGRTKLRTLLKKMRFAEIDSTFQIRRRIEAEERALMSTNLVIANSREEINTQWRLLYDGFFALETLWIPVVLKPGVEMKRFIWKHRGFKPFQTATQALDHSIIPKASECERNGDFETYPGIWRRIDAMLTNPDKPVILMLARPALEKNLVTMIETFGECKELNELCNLVIFAGSRGDIQTMPKEQQEVLKSMLLLIDKFNLYGKVAYPKTHERSDVSAIFSLPAYRGGVFANIALREPFGLTLIEAAVNGAPIIATRNGAGPEVVNHLLNGIAVDPKDRYGIANAILKIVKDKELWFMYHSNSLKNAAIYSWDGHVIRYINLVRSLNINQAPSVYEARKKSNGFDLDLNLKPNDILLVTDIDGTLIGSPSNLDAMESFRKFVRLFRENQHIKLALATGRSINSAIDYINRFDNKLLHECEFLITSVGSEIHYIQKTQTTLKNGTIFEAQSLVSDSLFHKHLSYRFARDDIKFCISHNFPDLEIQSIQTGHSALEQRYYKLSYVIRHEHDNFDDITDNSDGSSGERTLSMDNFKRRRNYSSETFDGDIGDERIEISGNADIDGDVNVDLNLLCSPSLKQTLSTDSMTSLYSMKRSGSFNFLNSSKSLLNLANASSFGKLSRRPMMGSTHDLQQNADDDSKVLQSISNALAHPNQSLKTRMKGIKRQGPQLLQRYKRENGSLNQYLHHTNIEARLKEYLRKQGLVCKVIVSHDRFVDILPIRSGKGNALRYLISRYNLKFSQIYTCGDSGNDFGMLTGLTQAIIVGNKAKDLETLKSSKYVYNARGYYAEGIIQGLKHYQIL